MCVTQVWTYRDCACSHERRLPCGNERAEPSNIASTSSPSLQSIDFNTALDVGHAAASTENLGYTNSIHSVVDDQASSSYQDCIDNHVVYKQFLEPLCDSCLMKELESDRAPVVGSSRNETGTILPGEILARYSRTDALVDEKLDSVSASEESIASNEEGVPVLAGDHAEQLKKHTLRKRLSFINTRSLSSLVARKQKSTSRLNSKEVQATNSPHSSSSSNKSLSSAGSVIVRGRKGDQAKALRRRAIDLSRDDLRVSSKWSIGEQQSMRNFRDALLETAKDKSQRVFSRFIKKEQEDWIENAEKKMDFVDGLKKSVSMTNLKEGINRSRSALKLGLSRSQEDVTPGNARVLGFRMTSRHEAIRNRYYDKKRAEEKSPGTEIVETEVTNQWDSNGEYSNEPGRIIAWETHLRHDLGTRQHPTILTTIVESDVEEDHDDDDEPALRAELPETKIPSLTKADICFTAYDPACYPTTTPTADYVNLRNNLSDPLPRLRYTKSQIPLLTKADICFTDYDASRYPSGTLNQRVGMWSNAGNPPHRLRYTNNLSRGNTIVVVYPDRRRLSQSTSTYLWPLCSTRTNGRYHGGK